MQRAPNSPVHNIAQVYGPELRVWFSATMFMTNRTPHCNSFFVHADDSATPRRPTPHSITWTAFSQSTGFNATQAASTARVSLHRLVHE